MIPVRNLDLFNVILVNLETYFLEQMCLKPCRSSKKKAWRLGSNGEVASVPLEKLGFFLNCSITITWRYKKTHTVLSFGTLPYLLRTSPYYTVLSTTGAKLPHKCSSDFITVLFDFITVLLTYFERHVRNIGRGRK